ncbi:MAG: hypothetical protein HYY94_01640 [Gemmatimonadetes bacterium]|nr:hypothetical protein [Gemmatimonadota bacterium]
MRTRTSSGAPRITQRLLRRVTDPTTGHGS